MPAQCGEPRRLLITGAPASGKTRLAAPAQRRQFRAGEHELRLRTVLESSGARAAQVLCLAGPATRAS